VRARTGLRVDRGEAELRLPRRGAAAPALILPMSSVGGGVYVGALKVPAAGRWLVELRLLRDGEVHYHGTQELVVP